MGRYWYRADGVSKPHTFVSEDGHSIEVLDRLSVLYMRDKEEFPLSKKDWEDILIAGYILLSPGSEKVEIWARRVGLLKKAEEIQRKMQEFIKRQDFLRTLTSLHLSDEFELVREERRKIKEVIESYSKRCLDPFFVGYREFNEEFNEEFKRAFEERPENADFNMKWQKNVLKRARELKSPFGWLFAAEVIADTYPKNNYRWGKRFLNLR